MRAISTFLPSAALALLTFFSTVALPTYAQTTEYKEGQHYQALANPLKPRDPSKIEVMEVFAYSCGHCNEFQPVLSNWAKTLADDVVLKHTPAMWNNSMKTHAKIFYTAKSLGKLKAMHADIFNALHVKKQKMLAKKQTRDCG